MHKSTVCQLLELEIVEPDLHKRDVAVGILDQVPQSLALGPFTRSAKEASAEAVNAIAYATKHHSEWFWHGAQHIKKVAGNGALTLATLRPS